MTEQEWLTSTDPQAMLEALRGGEVVHAGIPTHSPGILCAPPSDRKLRLFAQNIAYPVIGEPTGEDYPTRPMDWLMGWYGAESRTELPEQAALLRDIFGNPWRPWMREDAVIAGGPFPGSKVNIVWTAWLTWHDGIVPRLAEAAYAETGRKCEQCDFVEASGYAQTDFFSHKRQVCRLPRRTGRTDDGTLDAGRLAVLADALEEAGADADGELVRHLRGWEQCSLCVDLSAFGKAHCINCGHGWVKTHAPHVRGCWVIDMLLGKD